MKNGTSSSLPSALMSCHCEARSSDPRFHMILLFQMDARNTDILQFFIHWSNTKGLKNFTVIHFMPNIILTLLY